MNIVGHCPHCGAPIYAPEQWSGSGPESIVPPNHFTCECRHVALKKLATLVLPVPQPEVFRWGWPTPAERGREQPA